MIKVVAIVAATVWLVGIVYSIVTVINFCINS